MRLIRNLLEAFWETFNGIFLLIAVVGGMGLAMAGMWYLLNAFTYGWIVDLFLLLTMCAGQDFVSNYRKIEYRNRPR